MATVFNDKLFAETAFQQLTELLVPIQAFTTDVSSELKSEGDAVVVPLFGSATTTTFAQATDVYEQTGGTITAVTVTLDKRKITPVDLTAQQLVESSAAGRFDQWAFQLGRNMAETILSDVFSIITTGSFGSAVVSTASANFGREEVVDLRVALNQAGVPKGRGMRSLVINSDVESSLLKDTELTLAINRGSSVPLDEGDLGRLMGFDVYCADTLPYNSVSLTGFAAGKNAVAVAFRNLTSALPEQDYEAIEQVTDPESGLSMLYTRHWSRAQGKYFLNFHALYGCSAAVTNALKLAVTPAAS
jgi:hypothetical protein